MRYRPTPFFAVFATSCIAAAAFAQEPIGSEFAVNTYTTGQQAYSSIAVRQDGGFIVVWDSVGSDGDSFGVAGRRFDPTGAPLGAEFQVANLTALDQRLPAVGVDGTGDFAVVWGSQSTPSDGSGFGISARRFLDTGVPVAGEFLVNPSTTANQLRADVSMAPSGAFVVVWQDDYLEVTSGVRARLYDANGNPISGAIQVNETTAGFQGSPAVAMDDAGNFVAAWQSEGQDGDGLAVYARRFEADGDPVGAEFRANSFTTGSQANADVAIRPSGEFVVVWQSQQDGEGYGIYGQRYAANGSAAGGEFRVNLGTVAQQISAAVGMADDGKFVVVFRDAYHGGIFARAFDATGASFGGDFRVNSLDVSDQDHPSIDVEDDGDFVVAWESDLQDGSSFGIRSRRFRGNYLFRDSFESRNTAAWSATLP